MFTPAQLRPAVDGHADLNLMVSSQSVTSSDIAVGRCFDQSSGLSMQGVSDANLGQVGIVHRANGFHPQEILFPGFGLNTTQSGGTIPFDHRGGPNGGMEIGFWQNAVPTGLFGLMLCMRIRFNN